MFKSVKIICNRLVFVEVSSNPMWTFIALNLCLLTDSKALVPSHVHGATYNSLSVYLITVGENQSTQRKPTLKRGQVPTFSAYYSHLGVKCISEGHNVASAEIQLAMTNGSVSDCSSN